MKLFPKIPSVLEYIITVEYANYCEVCEVHDTHKIELCIDCDYPICYDYDDNIWYLRDTKKVICEKCVLKRAKTETIYFTSAKKFKFNK